MLYDLSLDKIFFSKDAGSAVHWMKVIEKNLSPWVKNFYQPFVIEHIKPEYNLTSLKLRSNDFPEFRPWQMWGKIYEGNQRAGFLKYRPYRYGVFDYSFAGIPHTDFDPAYPRIYKNKTMIFMDLMREEPTSLIVTSEMFLRREDISWCESKRLCQKARAAANPLWALHNVECPQIVQTAEINTVNYAFYLRNQEVAKKALFCKNIGAYNTDLPACEGQKDFLSVSCDAEWKLLLYDAADLLIEDKIYKKHFSDDIFTRDENTLFLGKALINHLHEVSNPRPNHICSHRKHPLDEQSRDQSSANQIRQRHSLAPAFLLKKWALSEGFYKE